MYFSTSGSSFITSSAGEAGEGDSRVSAELVAVSVASDRSAWDRQAGEFDEIVGRRSWHVLV